MAALPEYTRALTYIDNYLGKNIPQTVIQFGRISKEIISTGAIQLTTIEVKTKDIPAGTNWRWNQSRRKQIGTLKTQNLLVTYKKLIPRWKMTPSDPLLKPPKYKLWIFQVHHPVKEFYVLWCQQGEDVEPDINDYAFLRSFLPTMLSKEIWPHL